MGPLVLSLLSALERWLDRQAMLLPALKPWVPLLVMLSVLHPPPRRPKEREATLVLQDLPWASSALLLSLRHCLVEEEVSWRRHPRKRFDRNRLSLHPLLVHPEATLVE